MASTPIALALQGGGTHGAFAWGAVDQLLASGRVEISTITATSGGAMSAVVLADALAMGGPQAARDQLESFWRKVSVAAGMLPIRSGVMDKFLSNVGIDLSPSTIALDYITRVFSPYQFNLFDFNPLRSIVEEMVDFENLRKQKKVKLFINATHAKTGACKIFHGSEITLEAVMAAACLPFLFKTAEVDDEPYWDGGYSASPALLPLTETSKPLDVVIVHSLLEELEEVPIQAADILDRATDMSFINALAAERKLVQVHNRANPERELKLHDIRATELLSSLGRASKLNAEWGFLTHLHDVGAQAAQDWLEKF